MARLKPIFKKGDSSDVANYHPISNLNSISKLFERCILNQIDPDTDGVHQHGFKAGHSTTTAALEIQDALARRMDDNLQCLIYSVDLSAAFDLIRPRIFVKKALEVMDPGLVWLIHDFITGRKAFVDIKGEVSCTFELAVGCPQGSTPGPKIFNIYCNDLVNAIPGFLVSYADDSYVVVDSDCRDGLLRKAEKTLEGHLKWLNDNGMVCNISKTELMIMNSEEAAELLVDGIKVQSSRTMKVLGLVFDEKLEWQQQVQNTVTRTNRMLHGLKALRRFVSKDQARVVMTAFYFSVLYYGVEIWLHRGLGFKLKQKIRSAHYRAMRVILGQHLSRDELDETGCRASPD